MALQKTITLQNGMVATNAIHYVQNLAIYNKQTLNFNVVTKTASGAEVANKAYGCPYDILGKSPEDQAYDHLLTLGDFSNANVVEG